MSVPLEIIVKSDIGTVVSDQQKIQQSLGQTAIAAQKSDSSLAKVSTGLSSLGGKTQVAATALSSVGSAAGGAASEISSLGSTLLTGGILAAIPLIVIGLQELGDKLFGITAEQKAYNETLQNSVSGFVKANTTVAEMGQQIELAKQGFASKDKVLKDYNNTIGKSIGFAKDINEAEALLIAKGPAYIQIQTLKAAAQFALAKSGELLAQSIITANNAGDNSATAGLKALSDKIAKQSQVYSKLAEDLNKAALFIAKQNEISVVDPTKDPLKVPAEKITRHVRDINDVLNDLKKNLAYLEFREINLKTDEAKGKIAALESALAEIVKKFGKGAKNPIVIDLIARINVIKFEQAQGRIGHDESIEKQVQKELEHPIDAKIEIRPHFELKDFKKEVDAIGAIINETIQGVVTAAAEGIANLAAGTGTLGDFFSGIFKTLGSGLKTLGQYLVQTYGMIAILDKIKFSNPAVGVAIGFALQILGSLIQNKLSSTKGFATGVRNFQSNGEVVRVGERGAENVFLPRGSTVQPNNELNAYGGGGVTLQPSIAYDGTQFRIFLNRVDAQMSRNN